NLTNNIVITSIPGFIINEDDSDNDDGPITLVPDGDGNVALTPIYIKFNPSAAQAYSGNITNSSTGAVTKNVAVDGDGVSEVLVSTNSLTAFADTLKDEISAAQTYQVS